MFKHIDWCSCKTPSYGGEGCDCPEVDKFHILVNSGMSEDDAIRKIFRSDQNIKSVEVVKRSGKSIQL